MTWWTWMVFGALLLCAELFAIDAQFYLVFLGVSAGLVGLAALLGIAMPEWLQWVSFAVLGLIFMVTFRRQLYAKIHSKTGGFSDSLAGESLTISTDIAPGKAARVQYRGSDWTAVNAGENEIASGTRAKIIQVEGLTLHVSAD